MAEGERDGPIDAKVEHDIKKHPVAFLKDEAKLASLKSTAYEDAALKELLTLAVEKDPKLLEKADHLLEGKPYQKKLMKALLMQAAESKNSEYILSLAEREDGKSKLDAWLSKEEREQLLLTAFKTSAERAPEDVVLHRELLKDISDVNARNEVLHQAENKLVMASVWEEASRGDPAMRAFSRLMGGGDSTTLEGQKLDAQLLALTKTDLQLNGMQYVPGDTDAVINAGQPASHGHGHGHGHSHHSAQEIAQEYVSAAARSDEGGKALLEVMKNNKDNPELSAALETELKTQLNNAPEGSKEQERLKSVNATHQASELTNMSFTVVETDHHLKAPSHGGAKDKSAGMDMST